MIVIDASALLELLLRTPKGMQVEAAALVPEETLHAPELLDIEVMQALRRLVQLKQLTRARADEAIADHRRFAIARYSHLPLLDRIWDLRDAATAYDAAYLALAEALDAPLLTCDGKLAHSHGHGVRVLAV